MSYPVTIITRVVEIPGSMELVGAENLVVEASVTPSRSLTRRDGSGAFDATTKIYKSSAGEGLSIELPVTDQSGWAIRASGAELLVTEPNSYTHTYQIRLRILRTDDSPTGLLFSKPPMVLPTGNGSPVNFDELINMGSVATDAILIPWESFTGPPGQSAYAVAVAEGFVGDEAAWLASLIGPGIVSGAIDEDGALTLTLDTAVTLDPITLPPVVALAIDADGDYYPAAGTDYVLTPDADGDYTAREIV